jgi:hypothetical protein
MQEGGNCGYIQALKVLETPTTLQIFLVPANPATRTRKISEIC